MRIFFVFFFLLTACGDSPLFNHRIEKNSISRNLNWAEGDGIQFTKVNYSFFIDWKTGPELGESRFVLTSWNTETGTLNGPFLDIPFDIKVVLWMPAMGHGSSPTKITRLAAGEYEVSNIYFIMGGKWEVKIQLWRDGKLFDEVVIPYIL